MHCQTADVSDLVRLTHGLYRPAEATVTLADRCAAFLGVLPGGAVIAGLTAARMHGLWLPEARSDERAEIVLTRPGMRPRDFAGSRRAEIRVRRRSLRQDDVSVLDGLPVTTLERTWVDLGEVLAVEDLVAAGDSALRSGADIGALDWAIRRAARRRGVQRARQAFDLLDRRSRSRPESHLRCIVVLGGLPKPEVNEHIYNEDGEWLAEPDLHYKRARLALEYNGAGHADPERMRNDITREIDVDQGGWKSIVFGPAQVFGRPWQITPYVRTQLDIRDPGWRGRAA